MTTEILAFGFGCILIFIAVIGGGMEVKELKVPKVGRSTRIAALVGGVVFIGLGVGLPSIQRREPPLNPGASPVKNKEPEPLPATVETPKAEKTVLPVEQKEPEPRPATQKTSDAEKLVPAPSPVPPVKFTLVDELGPQQIAENVRIYINDQLAASLLVNQQQTAVSTTVRVPRPGRYAYTIVADTVFVDLFGQMFRQQRQGNGIIEVSEGRVFGCVFTPSGVGLMPMDHDDSDDFDYSEYSDFVEDFFDDWED